MAGPDTFSYVMTLAAAKAKWPTSSWVRITTITMISKLGQDINLETFRTNFKPMFLRVKGATGPGFAWTMKKTTFYNQVTIGYRDPYSNKSIKIFPNGSVQVAGCSDLFDCRRILRQVGFILSKVLGRPVDPAPLLANLSVKMINTNFSLNSFVNLNKVIAAFSAPPNQARINYLDEQISQYRPIIEGIERILAGSEATLLDLGPGGQFRRKVLEASIREDKKSLEEHMKILNEFITERRALGDKAPEGKFRVSFDPDRYSAVKIKFSPEPDMKQVTASIFSTGKIIVTGAQTLKEIAGAYQTLNEFLGPVVRLGPSEKKDEFGVLLGHKFEDWVPVLQAMGVKPWPFF